MTTPPRDDQRVGQLRNDVDDIYDMLGVINVTLADHGSKLDHIIEILERP